MTVCHPISASLKLVVRVSIYYFCTQLPKDKKEKNTKYDKCDEDVDYDISALFASPPQQTTQKRRRSSRPVVLEVKRSARLANKAAAAKVADEKKVAFTHSNSFQGA